MMNPMPVIKRFSNCRIRINARDHPPPHFHVLLNDEREAWVRIDTLAVIYGKVAAREIAQALTWAKSHRAMLSAKFEELQR